VQIGLIYRLPSIYGFRFPNVPTKSTQKIMIGPFKRPQERIIIDEGKVDCVKSTRRGMAMVVGSGEEKTKKAR